MFPNPRKHIRGSILLLADMLGFALVLGFYLSNVSYAQGQGENQGPGICNPEHRNSPEFVQAGCTGSFVSYRDSDIDRPEDGSDVVMEQSISSDATADRLIPLALIQTAGDCTFETKGDNPHKSANDLDVSVHGWWNDLSQPDCPTYADVEVRLQGLWCWNPPFNCAYITLPSESAHNEERYKARNLGGGRTNARHPCASTTEVSFRNVIDVDLVGVGDPSGYEYMYAEVACYPQ